MDEITIVTKWTSELTEEEIGRSLDILRQVYGHEFPRDRFAKQFERNIYGDSLHVFAYGGEKCVGTQVFWRNDIGGERAYQSGDSATLSAFRGRGIFTRMVNAGIERLGKGVLVYGFPNENSLPVFRKMGWLIGERKQYRLFTKKAGLHLPVIEDRYLGWMTDGNNELSLWRSHGKGIGCCLVKKKKWCLYLVIGRVSEKEERALLEKGVKPVTLAVPMTYDVNGKIGTGAVTIYSPGSPGGAEVPVYKIDTLLG